MEKWISRCGQMELRLGRWQEVLNRGRANAVISDPPYSRRTHDGHETGREMAQRQDGTGGRDLSYSWIDPADVAEFAAHWGSTDHCAGWIAVMTSHDLIPHWETALTGGGRYVFAPVPCIIPGMTCRRRGDGPSNWAVWLNVSRPRNEEFANWGTLPGEYRGGRDIDKHIGGKPLDMVSAIVRDYTRPGDLVCDPFAGFGTTLVAAAANGRRAIGAEADPETFQRAVERLSRGYTPTMFVE